MPDSQDKYVWTLETDVKGTPDIDRATQAMELYAKAEGKVSRAQKRAAEAQDTLNKARGEAPAPAASAPGSGGGGGGSLGGGPYSRLDRVNELLQQARKPDSGVGASRIKDLEYSKRLAERAIRRIETPAGPSVSPLMGHAASAMGLDAKMLTGVVGKLSGPLIAVAAAAALVKVSFEATAEAADRVNRQYTDVRSATGTSTQGAADLMSLGRVTGVDSASAAKAFYQRTASDPVAMSFAAQMGVQRGIGGPFGPTDQTTGYQQAIERVSAIQNRDERVRTARALGIEQEVGRYSLLSPNGRAGMDRTSQVSAQINDQDTQQRAAELMGAMARADQATQNVKDAFGKLAGSRFVDFLNMYAEMADQTALQINWLATLMNPTGSNSAGGRSSSGNSDSLGARQLVATDNLTTAITRLTAVTERTTTGGGERARGALPRNLSGAALLAAANSGALRTSAF